MPPFLECEELAKDLSPACETMQRPFLPGQPCIFLDDTTQIETFIKADLYAADLEQAATKLWIMTTPSSANIDPLHHQRVKRRDIILTEKPRLHLVWLHNRIFIKPIPRYLLSYAFWQRYMDAPLGGSHDTIRKTAFGFLRSYRYLIRHETDFKIAQELGLIPSDINWTLGCRFIASLGTIHDGIVSERYHFGELRLTRLNFYAPFLFRKFHYEKVHGQYGPFFARLYGPILFVLAITSTLLSAMQVALAAEQLVTVQIQWTSIWYVSHWFSILCMVGAMIVVGWFVMLWLYMFIDEWVYTLRQRVKRRR